MDKTLAQIATDVRRRLPNLDMRCMFDVGANIGQTVTRLRDTYPDAELWAFEPVPRTYAELVAAAGDLPGVHLENIALSARAASAHIIAKNTSGNNTIVTEPERWTQPIDMIPGDEFCRSHDIDHINYLKVDTEGHDLQVVRGFQGMLADYAIDVIEVEVGMNASNTKHVPYERFKGYLEPMGYLTFKIYEQVFEFDGRAVLRRANVLFVSAAAVETNIVPRVKAAAAP